MVIKLDFTDATFIKEVLIKAISTWDIQMTDESICQDNRDAAREKAKMGWQAVDLIDKAVRYDY